MQSQHRGTFLLAMTTHTAASHVATAAEGCVAKGPCIMATLWRELCIRRRSSCSSNGTTCAAKPLTLWFYLLCRGWAAQERHGCGDSLTGILALMASSWWQADSRLHLGIEGAHICAA